MSFTEAILGRPLSRALEALVCGAHCMSNREFADNALTNGGWRIALGHGDILLRDIGKRAEGKQGYINNPDGAFEERLWDVDRNYFGTGMDQMMLCRMVRVVGYPHGGAIVVVSHDGGLSYMEAFYQAKTKDMKNARPFKELTPIEQITFAIQEADLIGIQADKRSGQITTRAV